jgi:hypothetical protein
MVGLSTVRSCGGLLLVLVATAVATACGGDDGEPPEGPKEWFCGVSGEDVCRCVLAENRDKASTIRGMEEVDECPAPTTDCCANWYNGAQHACNCYSNAFLATMGNRSCPSLFDPGTAIKDHCP